MVSLKRLFLLFIAVLLLSAGLFSCEDMYSPKAKPGTDTGTGTGEDTGTGMDTGTGADTGTGTSDIPPPAGAYGQFKQKYMTYADEIAVMHINTKNGVGITSKETYVDATINIEGTVNYNISDWNVQIRGRGNSTWGRGDFPKKPYRIKAVNKTSIFGRPAVKNWALIANYSDKSLMRNYMTFMLGRSLHTMGFTPNAIFVEVYLNGRYNGLYCLQDHMEAKPSRVNVEGYILDGSGKLTDVGFLVEFDWIKENRNPGAVEGRDYFALPDKNFLCFLRYPQYDDDGFENNPALYQQAFDYVKDYVTSVHNAIIDHNKTEFESLCERDSFIDYFIVQEMSRDIDGGYLSTFFNKKPGGKMQMGPLWDYDLAFGNCNYIGHTTDYSSPEGWYIVRESRWFRNLLRTEDFYEDFRTRFMELSATNIQYTIDCIDPTRELIREAALRNFNRWKILGTYVWPNPPGVLARKTWDGQVDYIKEFWDGRNKWMYDELSNRNPIPDV